MPTDEPGFPAAPWKLRGEAIVAIKLVRTDLARQLIPSDAKVISVWPGRALALLYLSLYRSSPVGEYRELIFAPAMVWRNGRIGFWISHILVDNERSAGAGRTIWALPKQIASMQWSSGQAIDRRIHVSVDGPQTSLRASLLSSRRALWLPFIGAAMSADHDVERWFAVRGSARITTARAIVEADAESGLRELGFNGPLKVLACTGMKITIGRPQ
jgi:hypothetical protein